MDTLERPVRQVIHEDPSESIRVLVMSAYPAVRAGLSALLAQDPLLSPTTAPLGAGIPRESFASVSAAGPFAEFLEDERPPDVIVADISHADGQLADDLAERYPGIPLVLLGADPGLDGPGLAAGPIAYLGSDADAQTLSAAVRSVAAGLIVLAPGLVSHLGIRPIPTQQDTSDIEPLTPREREVLKLVAEGLPNKTIARELGISEHTAKFHVGSLLAKLGASSRTEAVTIATRRGLLTV
jgi:DNA-binding NarL/FixJ family response regulator